MSSPIPTSSDDRQAAELAAGQRPRGSSTSRRLVIAVAVTVAVLAAWVGAVRIGLGDDAGTAAEQPPLELSAGSGDGLASCLPFDVAVLSTMSPAFAATVTAVEGETITLAVDRWYAGGDAGGGAGTVVLHAPDGMEALIGGVDFRVGQQYLVTATDGTVNYCGYTGPATPQLTTAFEEAFAS